MCTTKTPAYWQRHNWLSRTTRSIHIELQRTKPEKRSSEALDAIYIRLKVDFSDGVRPLRQWSFTFGIGNWSPTCFWREQQFRKHFPDSPMLLSFDLNTDWPNLANSGELCRDKTRLRSQPDRQKVRLCLPGPWCQPVRHCLARSPEAQGRTSEECQG